MDSVSIAVGLYLAVFIWLDRQNISSSRICKCIVFCLLQAFMLIMPAEIGLRNFLCAVLNLVVFCNIMQKDRALNTDTGARMILVNPLPLIWCARGELLYSAIFAAVTIIITLFVYDRFELRFRSALSAFRIACVCALLTDCAIVSKGQKLSDLLYYDPEGAMPVLLTIGLAGMLLAAVLWVFRFVRIQLTPKAVPERKQEELLSWRWEGRDIVICLLLFVVSATVIVFKLGSYSFPKTTYAVSSENASREIILGFNEETKIEDMYICLDVMPNIDVSISSLKDDWVVVKRSTLSTVLSWNRIELNESFKNLGIVVTKGEGTIREIVLLDENGCKVTPYNSGYYTELFDEQYCFDTENLIGKSFPAQYREVFDEYYHVRTGYEYLHGMSIYENTHPPLGKLIIALGIKLFGLNPLGWRILPALLGALMIPVMYLFSARMSRKWLIGLLAAALLATSGMHLSLARLATLDTMEACFQLVMFWCMYRYIDDSRCGRSVIRQYTELLECGIAAGLAIATKWTGFYGAFGIAILFFLSLFERKHTKKELVHLAAVCALSFILVPFGIYILSYIPMHKVYCDKSLIQNVIDNMKLMFIYHSDCVFDHPYSSTWYQWMANSRPLLYALASGDGKTASASVFGNPLTMYGGLVAFVFVLRQWIRDHDKDARVLIILTMSVFLPWLMVKRTLFMYHYYPTVMMLCLLMAQALKNRRKLAIVTVSVSVALFILLYPVFSGMTVSTEWINQVLEFLPTWGFV